MFSVVYVAIALIFTAWALYVKRSRKIVFFTMLISLVVLGFYGQGCTCSVGSLQNIIAALVGMEGVKLGLATLLLFLLPVIATFFWGRVFCGGVCPLGGMQDILNIYHTKVPKFISGALRSLPILVFGIVAFAIIRGDGFLLCKYDFIVPLFRLNVSGILLYLTIGGIFLSLFFSRPFCEYGCPYGLLLGVTSLVSKRRVEITPKACVSCSMCGDVCVVDAIKKPSPIANPESKNSSRIWFIMAIVLIPVWSYLFAQVGEKVAIPQKINKRIEKLESKEKLSVKQEKRLNKYHKETLPFVEKGRNVGAVLGIFFGLMFLASTKRRNNEYFQTDPTQCVSCGRCYNHCPTGTPKSGPRFLDKIFGHLRHRVKEDKKAISRILMASSIFLGFLVILSSALLIETEISRSRNMPTIQNQSDLMKLRVQVKMRDADQTIKDKYYKLDREVTDKFVSAAKRQRIYFINLLISIILLSIIMKYRHNRYVLKSLKFKKNLSLRPIVSIYLERVGFIFLAVAIIVFVFLKF